MLDKSFFEELIADTNANFCTADTGSIMSSRMRVSTPLYVINALYGGGLPLGVISEISGPPGCFTGDTKIILAGKNKIKTIGELYNCKDLYNVYGTNGHRVIKCSYESVYIAGFVDDLMEVEIDGKYKIRCTPDHPFLTAFHDYILAENLSYSESLISITRGNEFPAATHYVSAVNRIKLEEKVPVYGLVNVGKNHNYAVALDNNTGVIVKNSGKSTFMYQCMANYQKEYPDGVPVIYDMEASSDAARLSVLGVDPSKVLRLPSTSLEDAFSSMFKMLNKIDSLKETHPNISSFQIYDSLAAGGTNKQHDATAKGDSAFGAGSMMESPRIIKQNLSNILPYLEKYPIFVGLLNQVFTNIGAYVATQKSGGGLGLKHICHAHITFGTNRDDCEDIFIKGTSSEVKLEKSKLSPKFQGIPCYIDVTKGGKIDEIDSFVKYLALSAVNIVKTGAWYSLKDTAKDMLEKGKIDQTYSSIGDFEDFKKYLDKNFRKDDFYNEVRMNRNLFLLLMVYLIDLINSKYPAQKDINIDYRNKLADECAWLQRPDSNSFMEDKSALDSLLSNTLGAAETEESDDSD